jgi:hypothetical protein
MWTTLLRFALELGCLALRHQMSQEDTPYHCKKGIVCQFKNGKLCPPPTTETGARRPRSSALNCSLTSTNDHMIRPIDMLIKRRIMLLPYYVELYHAYTVHTNNVPGNKQIMYRGRYIRKNFLNFPKFS